MKANELRLGNLIKIGGNTLDTYQTFTPTKVTLAILNEIAGENEERPDAELSVFQPIPLTEEWLERFGLAKFPYSWSCGLFHLTEWDEFPNNWCVAFNKNNAVIVLKLKYVHQLQNLYFALKDEELPLL